MGATNNIRHVRTLLAMSQEEFGEALGMSQGNVSHYECQRQEVPPDVARRIIVLAKGRGQEITFEQIYASPAVE